MESSHGDREMPYRRLQDPELQKDVLEHFANLLEDRATDPKRKGGASELLAEFAEKVRRGERIPRTAASLSIFRGVFAVDGPMDGHHITQGEVDVLEKTYFEPKEA